MALNHLLTEKYLNLRNVKEAAGGHIAPEQALNIIQSKYYTKLLYFNIFCTEIEFWHRFCTVFT